MSFTIFQNEKKPLKVIKTRSEKSQKNCHCSQGGNPRFWSKTGHFFNFFFLGNIGQENVFCDILERKTPFQALKTRSSKSRKIGLFPKGLTNGLSRKKVIFPNSFFQTLQARKMCFTTFQNKKTPFQAIKTRISKSRKIDIFSERVNLWFLSRNCPFFNFFFLANRSQENVFYDIVERKNPFLGFKNKKFKK